MSTTTEPLKKIVYLLRVETINDENLLRRLRIALKMLRRQFGLRAVTIKEEKNS
jgi:hypothetical protein